MLQSSPTQRARPSEEGYVLVAVVFMTVILVLSLAVAIPRIRESIQRDREIETVQRGKQYIRAVQLYYRKFHAYPPNVDALVKTNNIRFLRKKYVDPTTAKEEWKPVMFGQNKTPQAIGFFGQPLAAAAGAGIGPAGGNAQPGAIGAGTGLAGSAGNGLFNTTTTGGSTDAGAPSTPAAGPAGGTAGGTDPNGNPTTGGSQAGSGAPGGSQPGGTSPGTGSASTSSSTSGQTFGGAGIIGFSPQSPKQSLYVYKKKNHYNEWEFLYSPLSEQQTAGGGNTGTIGQPASSTTTPVGPSTPTLPSTPSTPGAPPGNPPQ
jgi:type II secretory pathway pseudopilin PulG